MITIVGNIIDSVVGFFMKRQEHKNKKREHEMKLEELTLDSEFKIKQSLMLARIEAAKEGSANLIELDRIAVNDMKYTFKDELLLILFSIPFIMAFIPSLRDDVAAGFAVIKTFPLWYELLYTAMIVTIYGMRSWFKSYVNISGK
jgi:hypothetical protein